MKKQCFDKIPGEPILKKLKKIINFKYDEDIVHFTNIYKKNRISEKEEEKVEKIFKTIASWLFLIGIVVSVIVGLIIGAQWWADTEGYIALLLAILGFVVGILSFFAVGTITQEKLPTFLIAALILVGIGATAEYFTNLALIGEIYLGIAGMLAVFAAPAAGILAIRAIWDAGKSKEIEKVIPKLPTDK